MLVTSFAIVCPGPAVALAVSNALHFRFKIVLLQTLGNLLGLAIISSLVILSIDQLGDLSAHTLAALRLSGAAYITFIGWRHIRHQSGELSKRWGRLPCGNKCSKAAFVEGFVIAATNPQTLLLFLSLFPNFVDVEASVGPQVLLLVPSVMAISFFSLMSYGFVAHCGKRRFVAAMRPEMISKIMGGFLLLFGILLALMQLQTP